MEVQPHTQRETDVKLNATQKNGTRRADVLKHKTYEDIEDFCYEFYTLYMYTLTDII